MQILHISEESLGRVERALDQLNGGKYKLKDKEHYKETGNR